MFLDRQSSRSSFLGINHAKENRQKGFAGNSEASRQRKRASLEEEAEAWPCEEVGCRSPLFTPVMAPHRRNRRSGGGLPFDLIFSDRPVVPIATHRHR
jgi:hypothetical protein